MLDELEFLAQWLNEDRACCMAIVSQTWGSAPRTKDSIMIVRDDGIFEGSVSGGCVEADVVTESLTLIKTGDQYKSLTYAVANEDAWQVGLACGGEIKILIFKILPSQAGIAVQMCDKIRKRHAFTLSLDLKTGDIRLTEDYEISGFHGNIYALKALPRRRLLIIGAVHIAQKLCDIAAVADYDITIIDPRPAFVDQRAFQDAEVKNCWPDEFFKNITPDNHTALVILTHDPKIDDLALKAGLDSDIFYIGALGSPKTHNARVKRLLEEGCDQKAIDKIKGPIGLNIGAKNPAEIAVAIMAEITLAYRGAKVRGTS